MLTLTDNNKIILNNLLYDAFGGLNEYLNLIDNRSLELNVILRHNNTLKITRSWERDNPLNLADLGHIPNRDIVMYNLKYQEIARFVYSPTYGNKVEHRLFINSLRNGELYYLNLETINGPNLILCIACNTLPDFKRQLLIRQWLQEIEWDIYKPVTSEAFLAYSGNHNLIVYYLPIEYSPGVNLTSLLSSPDKEIFEFSINDILVLLTLRKGFYAIADVDGDSITWLQITNIAGSQASSYIYQNGVNYLGQGLTTNLTINISGYDNNTNTGVITPSNTTFSITGDLVAAFTNTDIGLANNINLNSNFTTDTISTIFRDITLNEQASTSPTVTVNSNISTTTDNDNVLNETLTTTFNSSFIVEEII